MAGCADGNFVFRNNNNRFGPTHPCPQKPFQMLSRIFTTAESVVMRRCAKMLTTQPIAHYQTQSSANATTHIKAPWYTIKQEERIPQPSASTGDEDAFVFEPKPQFKKLFNVLSQLRCHYPREVWHSITRMYPHRSTPTKPICVDIAVGAWKQIPSCWHRRFNTLKHTTPQSSS